ncbi:MAG: helix-turn-helix transcriptional regulator [Erysipelotrichaceae bacterium]|nr:helix-turn-helix transcriptional regulator [Erysipelotrichaceae bacterium]
MIRFVDLERFEETFARMLSAFHHDGGLSFEHITRKIVEGDYFDFLEKNDWDALEAYSGKSYQTMLRELFGFEFNKNLSEEVGPVYWAGKAYMKVFFNYRIPLKQLFLLCPLEKMVGYFSPFHEMGFSSVCDQIRKEDCRASILKTLRKTRGYTVAQLSILTDISKTTLTYYELDNDHLFKASSDNMASLARSLKADPSIFRRRSFFNPMSRFLLRDAAFSQGLLQALTGFYGLPHDQNLPVFFQNDIEGDGLYVGQRNLLVINGKTISVPDSVIEDLVYARVIAFDGNGTLLY